MNLNDDYIKESFNKNYPNLSFDDLIKQRLDIRTKDRCTHYRYNDIIFSWENHDKKWIQHSKEYQNALLNSNIFIFN